jgi:uncharacterized protein (DUF1697 family)
MSRLVALMRGINVGRNKRIAMGDLRAVLTGLGYTDVRTLLMSGNAVFTCSSAAAKKAASDIERAVAADLGVRCAVIVRSEVEVAAAIEAAPLIDVATDPSRHFVGFLAAAPPPRAARAVAAIDLEPDLIRLVGKEVYLWCPKGLLDSPLAKAGWEKSLEVPVTLRNWNTVTKIAAALAAE